MGDFRYMGKSLSGVPSNISALTDANISNPQDGDILVYNGTTGKWEARGYVEVLGGSGKTFGSSLTELWNAADKNKITNKSYLSLVYGSDNYIYQLGYKNTSRTQFHFNLNTNMGSSTINFVKIIFRASSPSWGAATIGATAYSYTDQASTSLNSGNSIRLYY